jgi:hypothetical protein
MTRHVPSAVIGPRVTFTLPKGVPLPYRDSAVSLANEPLILLHGVGVTADLNWGATYAVTRATVQIFHRQIQRRCQRLDHRFGGRPQTPLYL